VSYPVHIRKIADQYWKGRASVSTILDLAHDEIIYSKMLHSDIEYVCLFEGRLAAELEHLAPYLIRLHKNNPFTEWLFDNGGGKNWGIFIQSPADMNTLIRHFRRFVRVYDEEGTPMMFRFYDPRVFRVYLPTCNKSEREYVFGPVERYYAEGRNGEIIVYASDEGRQIMRGEKKESALIIRREQMEAFERDSLRQFEEEITDFVRYRFPEVQDKPETALRVAVHEQVAKARSYGLETGRQVITYVTVAWLMGHKFDTDFPDIGKFLKSYRYSPDNKAERLVRWTEQMLGSQKEE